MTIIRLPDRRLFIHSPLPIDAELKREIESLGNVSAVVAPNTQHVDFIGHWKKHFPSAVCLGPPGCIANRTDVPFDAELNVDESAHESYADEYGSLEQIYVPGSEMMGETIFYHPSSKTLLVTDLIFTFGKEGVPRGVRWGHGFLTAVWWWLYTWFLQRDKQAFRRMLVRIEQLDYETLVPTHGSVVGRSQAEAAFKDWFRA